MFRKNLTNNSSLQEHKSHSSHDSRNRDKRKPSILTVRAHSKDVLLPSDLMQHVVSFLRGDELTKVRRVSHFFNSAVSDFYKYSLLSDLDMRDYRVLDYIEMQLRKSMADQHRFAGAWRFERRELLDTGSYLTSHLIGIIIPFLALLKEAQRENIRLYEVGAMIGVVLLCMFSLIFSYSSLPGQIHKLTSHKNWRLMQYFFNEVASDEIKRSINYLIKTKQLNKFEEDYTLRDALDEIIEAKTQLNERIQSAKIMEAKLREEWIKEKIEEEIEEKIVLPTISSTGLFGSQKILSTSSSSSVTTVSVSKLT